MVGSLNLFNSTTGDVWINPFLPWPFIPKGYCRCLRLSVCPPVRPSARLSVRQLYLFCAISRHRFGLKSPNLHQTCILGYPRLVLKVEVIDHDLQSYFVHFDLEFYEIWFVRAITRHRFGLESRNLHQTCILGYYQLVLITEVIDLDLQDHFGLFDLEFLEIWLVPMINCNGFELESPNLHQICLFASLDSLNWYWKWRPLTLTFKVWPSFRLKKLHSKLLLCTDLGRPRGVTRPKRALVSNLGLCAACWAHFMCHHELWPTSVSHPFSSLNSSWCLAGGKYYQKLPITIFRLVLQNFALPCWFPYVLFYHCLFSLLSPSWVVIAVCNSISVQGTN